ncbi:hypothetical protein [Bacillus thuringiensis]|nr:hypothetical protein [Bacillus thuringiensis]
MNKKKEAHYVHVYTFRDKIVSWCSLKEEMQVYQDLNPKNT